MVVSDYNTKFLDKNGTDHLIDELKAYVDSIETEDVDLSDYYKKSETYNKEEIACLIPVVLTEDDVNTLIDNKLGVIENGTY